MGKKIALILLILSLVGILIVAGILYRDLGTGLAPDRLAGPTQTATSPSGTQPPETAAEGTQPPETTAPQLQLAPDFTVFDAGGNPHKLSDFFGKPIVLNFWASWCGPCKMEMPDFQEKYLEQGQQIQFLMVNLTDGQRETVETASAFIASQGYSFPVFYDTAYEAANTYGVYSIPATYFLDALGQGVAWASGALDAETLQKGIDMITGG